MAKILDTQAYLDAVCDMLQTGAVHVPVNVAGTSMTPFLDPGDTVLLDLPKEAVQVGDVILFVRFNGRYVLHRVVSIQSDRLELLGDAQIASEWIAPDQVRAVVTAIRRGDKLLDSGSLRWRFFRGPWRKLRTLRPYVNRVRSHLLALRKK